ncbi:hypothetical protein BJD55_gp153 [Gordonia phage Yvonnetastic]|uniref:Uncharacterized protein n=1 Tax=Gordonia phage Yvonnetastic TaxID=1821566 RepID=A0A142K930_9CAUD|nr:hypothetical protein BJD55_gp153 [Gordonia phage Yvonnetastic]AMS02613.1 hypothetical protein SEA_YVONNETASTIC_69 [Gordonia phage Yvonnetastic]
MKLRIHKEINFGIEPMDDGASSTYMGIKGTRITLGKYALEIRRKLDHEKSWGVQPATPTHWWRPGWGGERGKLYDEAFLSLRNWCVEVVRHNISFAEYCGVDDLHLDWILDEFDSSFNELAAASLKFHLELSICDNEPRRELYEDLIARLTEEPPDFTDEEMAILEPEGWKWSDDFEDLPEGGARLRKSPPEKKAVYEAHWKRKAEYDARVKQARHDFVDIMPHLWS